VKVTIGDRAITEAQEVLNAFYGIALRKEQVLKYARRKDYIAIDLHEGIFDTGTRESLLQEVAKDVTGRSWPLCGEGDRAYNKFIKLFTERAHTKGIRISTPLVARSANVRKRKPCTKSREER